MSEQNSRPPREIIRAIPSTLYVRAEDDTDVDTDPRPVLSGYFGRFNEWTEIDSWFEGRFMERIAPGAYKKTFRERRDELRVLFQHGRDPMVGDKPIAEIQELREDDDGAYHESRLLDGVPELIVSGLRAGQYGQSFRMEVMREEIVDDVEPSDTNPHGLPERTIKEIRLHEFGPVTFPAYKNTTPALRSLTDEFVFDWLARNPERARELVGKTHFLARAALVGSELLEEKDQQDPAPSSTDAAPSRTSATERRDSPDRGRYGLESQDPRPSWAL